MAFLLGVNSLYGGAWLVLGLIGILALWFGSHPRLSSSRQTVPFLTFFGCVAMAIWMRATGPSPIRVMQAVSNSIPALLLVFAAGALFLFFARRESTNPGLRYAVVPAILFCLMGWAVVFFSGSNGGPDPMIHWLSSTFGMTDEQARLATVVVRKIIHFTFYGSVALNACHLAGPKKDLNAAAGFGVLCALTFAGYDEFRQSTSPGRTGSAWDVGLDMLGAFCFVGLLVLLYRSRSQREVAVSRPDL